MQILVSIQQSSNDLLQTIPSIFHKTNCKDVYVTKSLFKTTFFEDLLALVKDVFDNMSIKPRRKKTIPHSLFIVALFGTFVLIDESPTAS